MERSAGSATQPDCPCRTVPMPGSFSGSALPLSVTTAVAGSPSLILRATMT